MVLGKFLGKARRAVSRAFGGSSRARRSSKTRKLSVTEVSKVVNTPDTLDSIAQEAALAVHDESADTGIPSSLTVQESDNTKTYTLDEISRSKDKRKKHGYLGIYEDKMILLPKNGNGERIYRISQAKERLFGRIYTSEEEEEKYLLENPDVEDESGFSYARVFSQAYIDGKLEELREKVEARQRYRNKLLNKIFEQGLLKDEVGESIFEAEDIVEDENRIEGSRYLRGKGISRKAVTKLVLSGEYEGGKYVGYEEAKEAIQNFASDVTDPIEARQYINDQLKALKTIDHHGEVLYTRESLDALVNESREESVATAHLGGFGTFANSEDAYGSNNRESRI